MGEKALFHQFTIKKNLRKKIINIHIQNPKVSLKNFDFIIAPDHDDIEGQNVLISKGAIHYLTLEDINNCKNYLEDKIDKNRDVIHFNFRWPYKIL